MPPPDSLPAVLREPPIWVPQNYRRCSPEGLSFAEYGSGEPIILIHGYSMPGEMFGPLVERYKADYRLIVPDLRGLGHSQDLPVAEGMETYAEDIARLLDDLGIQQASILGYSMGGAVAQTFARRYPERTTRLILCATFACRNLTLREKVENLLGIVVLWLFGSWLMAMIIRPYLSTGQRLASAIYPWLRAHAANNTRKHLMAAYRALRDFDSLPWLHELQMPALILVGDKDNVVVPKHALMLRQNLPHAHMAVLPEGGHGMIFSHTTVMAHAIREFLEQEQLPEGLPGREHLTGQQATPAENQSTT